MASQMKNVAIGAVSLIVVVILFVATVPTVIEEVQDVNTTAWNFTGSSGAVSLWLLIPFAIIAGVLIYILVKAFNMGGGSV